jgi:hypothetical protein
MCEIRERCAGGADGTGWYCTSYFSTVHARVHYYGIASCEGFLDEILILVVIPYRAVRYAVAGRAGKRGRGRRRED